jgi:D-inositol-3-phosphate glycosyltransferase
MRALLLTDLSQDYESKKQQYPSRTLMQGAYAYQTQVVKAILRYGVYDQYFFLEPNSLSQERLAASELLRDFKERVRIVTAANLLFLNSADQLVMFKGDPFLASLLPLRSFLKRPDVPVVGVIHSLNGKGIMQSLAIQLIDARKQDALICSSQAGRLVVEKQLRIISERMEAVAQGRIQRTFQLPVIPLGINTKEFAGIAKEEARAQAGLPLDKVVILYFGRLNAAGKCDLRPFILTFANSLSNWAKECVLVLAGDDTEEHLTPSLKELTLRLGCAPSVVVKPDPTPEEKRLLYAAADLFIAPSDSLQETFGITVIEAMAAGLPVIAADWSGYKELVAHGSTGFLVPTYMSDLGDVLDVLNAAGSNTRDGVLVQTTVIDLDAFQHYLHLLVTNPSLRVAMGARARKIAEAKYDWKVIIRQYEALWDELLGCSQSLTGDVAAGAGHGFLAYSSQDVFHHYPTSWLANEDYLQVNLGRLSTINEQDLFRLLCEPIGPAQARLESIFTGYTFDAVLRVLKAKGPTPMQAIIEELRTSGFENSLLVKAHIARLLKYGALQLMDKRSADSAKN